MTDSGGSEAVRIPLRRFFRRTGSTGIDVRFVAIRHLIRGHQGEALLCEECRNG